MSQNLSIDLQDPAVRSMLGGDGHVTPGGAKKRELVQIAGDAVDPTGTTSNRGLQSTIRLDGGKQETLVLFRGRHGDFVMTVDVYAMPGEATQIHFICPKCHKQGRITSDQKAIDWNPVEHRVLSMPDGQRARTGGILSVEPFGCTWEMGAEAHTPGIRSGGLTLCGMKIAIDANVAREA